MVNDVSVLEFEKPIVEIENKIENLKAAAKEDSSLKTGGEIKALQQKCEKLKKEIYGSLNSWQRVQLARHPKRPYTLDFIELIFTDFIELHGDRSFKDDRALVCGIAFLGSYPAVIIGQQKGRDIQENMDRNFAMAHPEGYRKALRVMKLAEKFSKPVITFIDTPGAYPGIGAEERGQAEAIARNLREMAGLKVPIISIVIGEGGSGGALGIGVANRVLMLENAYYSVITPEGCAAILFRDAAKAPQAADALRVTAQDLYEMKVVDEIIPEPLGGAHKDVKSTADSIKKVLTRHLAELRKLTQEGLLEQRYRKYRKLGVYSEDIRAGKERRGKKQKRK